MKSILLLPLSLLYGLATGVRNMLFDLKILKSTEFKLPIISVGNITVGGTGKTPHTEYIVDFLKDTYNVAVLSRGYMRKTKEFELATHESTTSEIGDELKQVKRKFPDIVVAADADRVNGINKIKTDFPDTDVVILDDAFQHRKVKPGLSILLIDFGRLLNKDILLPAGRLRESPKQAKRADIVIITKSPPEMKPFEMRTLEAELKLERRQDLFFSAFEYGDIVPIFKEQGLHLNFKMCKEQDYYVSALSGIANPSPFENYIKENFTNYDLKSYADHYSFTLKDIVEAEQNLSKKGAQKKIIFVTEKDAVKIREVSKIPNSIKPLLFYIPIKPVILNNKAEEFEGIITKFIKNKSTKDLLSSDDRRSRTH